MQIDYQSATESESLAQRVCTPDCKNPSEEFLRSLDIHEILPQQEPFVMIDTMRHFEMLRVVTSFEIKSSNMFVTDGRLTSSGIIENIAQTCAARIGYINKYILRKTVEAGVIGAVKDLEIYNFPHTGDVLKTAIKVGGEAFGMILVQAKVYVEGTLIADGEMKLGTY